MFASVTRTTSVCARRLALIASTRNNNLPKIISSSLSQITARTYVSRYTLDFCLQNPMTPKPVMKSSKKNSFNNYNNSIKNIKKNNMNQLLLDAITTNNTNLLFGPQHYASPVTIGWFDVPEEEELVAAAPSSMELMNRNARRPKRANHGKRPCSRQTRRQKRRAFGNWRR